MITTRVTIKEEEKEVTTKPQPTPPILPPQYPPECLYYRTLSLPTMWEMGIMKKWVEDFASCEELLYGELEKVNLVIRNQKKGRKDPI